MYIIVFLVIFWPLILLPILTLISGFLIPHKGQKRFLYGALTTSFLSITSLILFTSSTGGLLCSFVGGGGPPCEAQSISKTLTEILDSPMAFLIVFLAGYLFFLIGSFWKDKIQQELKGS